MTAFWLAVIFTLGVSAFCSLLEAMILSTTAAEIETLKARNRRKGEMLETFKQNIEETSSAILSLNTVANTLGATICGVLAASIWGSASPTAKYVIPLGMTVSILLLSEILPKNLGVLYRPAMQPHMVMPLHAVRVAMRPISGLCSWFILLIAGRKNVEEIGDEEIRLLAEKSAKEGSLTEDESLIISNALKLDEIRVIDEMTPRTVVLAFDKDETVGEVFAEHPNVPFARMPVYEGNIDNIVGLVRRRDLLKAKANDEDGKRLSEIMHSTIFVQENASGAHALEKFLSSHQQLAVVVDEFGSTAGVITMEDIIEHILGQEIFEKDDMAVDMRELARQRHEDEEAENGHSAPQEASDSGASTGNRQHEA
ncbi:HlyC/CorC family transporter [Ruficoccus amylovorans]|uniref:HlyC/CorC family transporter n=1 Tax=Ruficoccus amylovorans TaxID=1804625 RepID=A0A842HKB5_9BACT|nr:hemolysin family protein [Ruficoccus amylovorans]MBC2596114.1 HlyC/CorC family transporter [Ruficoccus amylovorans]